MTILLQSIQQRKNNKFLLSRGSFKGVQGGGATFLIDHQGGARNFNNIFQYIPVCIYYLKFNMGSYL